MHLIAEDLVLVIENFHVSLAQHDYGAFHVDGTWNKIK